MSSFTLFHFVQMLNCGSILVSGLREFLHSFKKVFKTLLQNYNVNDQVSLQHADSTVKLELGIEIPGDEL